MLRSLLVPLDGSEMGEWSLPLASGIARATGAEIHLAHVHVPHDPDQLLASSRFQWEGVDVGEYDRRHRGREGEYLDGWEDRLEGEGAVVDTTVLDGTTIADELVAHADRIAADLIVMTSHGRSGIERALWGSVADGMIRKATSPILVIRPDREGRAPDVPATVEHILIPLDGSRLAEGVLGPAMELAWATGARITLTHVVSDLSRLGPGILGLKADRFEPTPEGALGYLEPLVDDLRAGGFRATARPVSGDDPATSSAELADELGADVIAVATHGHGGIKRAILGSVTDRLLGATHRPMLIVRPREERRSAIPWRRDST